MGSIQDLLQEVPLAAVLRERVALADQKYEAVIRQAEELKQDPSAWAQGAAALKAAFDSIRTALSIAKDVRSLGCGSDQQQKAIDNALSVAASSTAIAEAELAKAFGYQLCKCEFPPIPMRTVGSHTRNMEEHMRVGDPVYEGSVLDSPNNTSALRISMSPGPSAASSGLLTPRLLSNRRALFAI
jgi:hypothetical protein